jgi:Tol biopolymer transport system component
VVYERILQPASTQHLVPTFSRDPEFELLLSEPFPAFSPDGKKLLYSQYGANGLNTSDTTIQMMNADGSGKQPLYHKEGISAFDAVWSPAGDMIAFCVGRYFRAAGLPSAQIALIKPDGSGYREIAEEGVNNGFPSWSPDGNRLVYKRGKHLVIQSIADGKIVPLTDGAHYDNFPKWSPKGDAILFTTDRDGDFELYTIRPDGSGLRRAADQFTGERCAFHLVRRWGVDRVQQRQKRLQGRDGALRRSSPTLRRDLRHARRRLGRAAAHRQ